MPIHTVQNEQTSSQDLFAAFTGSWGRHGYGLDFRPYGEAYASWRTYEWCDQGGRPPCDRIVGNSIISGGHAVFVFTRVDGNIAYGEVGATSDTASMPNGTPALMILQPNGMATLLIGNSSVALCGPRYLELAPPEVQQQSPCGA